VRGFIKYLPFFSVYLAGAQEIRVPTTVPGTVLLLLHNFDDSHDHSQTRELRYARRLDQNEEFQTFLLHHYLYPNDISIQAKGVLFFTLYHRDKILRVRP
jgi:hypothetical protein